MIYFFKKQNIPVLSSHPSNLNFSSLKNNGIAFNISPQLWINSNALNSNIHSIFNTNVYFRFNNPILDKWFLSVLYAMQISHD